MLRSPACANGHGREYVRSARPRRKRASSFHFAGPQSTILGSFKNRLVEDGPSGVRFLSLSDDQKAELQDWLSQELEETLPEFVAGNSKRRTTALADLGDGEQLQAPKLDNHHLSLLMIAFQLLG